jgi:hypothetical protein
MNPWQSKKEPRSCREVSTAFHKKALCAEPRQEKNKPEEATDTVEETTMTKQEPARESRHTADVTISATSHCRDGKLPRWSFLIASEARGTHGMVGTDGDGRGLYLYASNLAHMPGKQLVAPERLNLPDTLSRHQANHAVMAILSRLDPRELQAAAPKRTPFVLYAVS